MCPFYLMPAIRAVGAHTTLFGTRSTCAMSLWLTELESPSSQAMVTSLQDVPVTVPRSVALAFQQTRSPIFRSLDWSPVIAEQSFPPLFMAWVNEKSTLTPQKPNIA